MGNFVSSFFKSKKEEGLGLESYRKLVNDSGSKKIEPKEDLHELFSPLTDEDEDEVLYGFSGDNGQLLVTHKASNIEITRDVLQCLTNGAWLNDDVINLYLELLKERERREPERFLKCHFFNTFFYKRLISGRNGYDFNAVRRWTTQRKLGYGLIECVKIFVPIHKDIQNSTATDPTTNSGISNSKVLSIGHWCLAVINIKDKSFQYLDSRRGMDNVVLKVLLSGQERQALTCKYQATYFMDEVKDKSNKQIDTTSWKQEIINDLPLQGTGGDCGMFMLKYIDFYSRGLGLHFSQDHMEYFRKRTAKEILRLRAE